jgi:hypothetical protein
MQRGTLLNGVPFQLNPSDSPRRSIFKQGRGESACVRAGRVEADEVTLRWHVRRGIIKPGCELCKAVRKEIYERI